ncbi:hypothetical protein TNCV_1574711 [Trichonephila clavipes]|nr:hypothetical protein TNCV_1574711 [Trichonephila clavipes]
MKENEQKLDAELKTTYGEIALITCPMETCQIHNPKINSNKNATNDKPKNDLESIIDKVKSKKQKRPAKRTLNSQKRPRAPLRRYQ